VPKKSVIGLSPPVAPDTRQGDAPDTPSKELSPLLKDRDKRDLIKVYGCRDLLGH
jgi:hypothetical protein